MKNELDKLDSETNWSQFWFTPLEASVEIHNGKGKIKKKIKELINAIKADKKSKTFLVIGDPGGGKSVALRRLSRELLKEVEKTWKIPVYINLKEWTNDREWSEKEPPKSEELLTFIMKNLKERLNNVFTERFIDKYFEKMVEHGRVFFIFDSFDEIPSVLDVDESSWLIKELSALLYNFITSGKESRGVLASRMFRRPSNIFRKNAVLEIRPFSEGNIRDTLHKSLKNYTVDFEKKLFHEKCFLISSARNPFITALIANYADCNNNELPNNQAELYEEYINSRLSSCESRISKKNLRRDDIIKFCMETSFIMFDEPLYGLEIPLEILEKKLPDFNVADIVDVIVYARLGRLGQGEEKRFSFVHRRFNEYFIVKKFMGDTNYVNSMYKDTIMNDLRLRDALVLYCEIADDKETEQIAKFCWEELSKIKDDNVDINTIQYLKSIHCLRFLTEALRNRKELTASFRSELNLYILDIINNRQNLLEQKLAIESTGILEEKIIDEVILKALSINNTWISECAIRSCRYLQGLSKELRDRILKYLKYYDEYKFIKRRKEFLFIFSLSDEMGRLLKACYAKYVNIIINGIAVLLSVILSPRTFLPTYGTALIAVILFRTLETRMENYRNNFNMPISLTFKIVTVINIIQVGSKLLGLNIQNTNIEFFITNLRAQWIFFVIIILLSIPYCTLYYYIVLMEIRKIELKTFLPLLYIVIPIIAFTLLIIALSKIIPINILISIIFTLLLLVGVYFLFNGIKMVYKIIVDIIFIHKLKGNLIVKREVISENFYKLKGCSSRCKYLELIRECGIKAIGKWPDGDLPNINNDKSSTLLASLEEKWLNLD